VTIVVFWVCTIPGVISQAYLIFLAGGLLEYAAAISRRVVEYQGLGWARLLVSTIFSINIVYYAYGVLTRMPRTWWLFYYVHFAILIAFAAVSGSRSALLNIFLAQMLVWHYGRRAIKLKFAAVTALVLIGFAIVLGAVRETTKIEQGEVISTAEDAAVVFRHFSVFSYGVAPIDMLIRSDLRQLQYGSTFLTLITNIIPRPIWPEKPDTGGVFFTKIYANNAWDGLSNMTPTFLGEWVINFGWGIGGLFFVISYSALFFYVIRLNSKIFSSVNRSVEMRSVFIAKYIFIVLAACALLVGEVTNVILGFVFSQYLPLVAVSTLMKLRLRLD
jgi:oligosaccharide repeat unit polymerase